MGVSNFNFYEVTQHAKDRYIERIDSSKKDDNSIKKAFITIMHRADYLGRTANDCEAWLDREENIVLILKKKQYKIITVYHNLDDYREKEKEFMNEKEGKGMHLVVKNMLAEFSKKAYLSQEKNYYSAIGPLFKEYGERMDNLSRMKNPKDYMNKQKEMTDTFNLIKEIEEEKTQVLSELKMFFNE